MEADVEEVRFKRDDMVVFWCARNVRSIVARLHKEAGDFDNGSHGNDAGVGGEGYRWLLVRASVRALVGDRAGVLVVASVSRRLGSEKNRSVAPVGTSFGQSLGRKRLWDGRERFWDVGWFWPRSVRDLEVNGVDTLVGRSLRYKRRRYVVQVIG